MRLKNVTCLYNGTILNKLLKSGPQVTLLVLQSYLQAKAGRAAPYIALNIIYGYFLQYSTTLYDNPITTTLTSLEYIAL